MLNALNLALARPTYGQGLFDVGRNATAHARANIYNDSLQKTRSGLLGAHNLGIDPGQSNPDAALSAIAQGSGMDPKEAIQAYQAGQQQRAIRASQEAQAAQQEALVKYFEGKSNKELAALSAIGVVTPQNVKDWMNKGRPTVLKQGDIMVSSSGEVIAKNPRTGGQSTKDYTLTGAEVETYESIIKTNETLKASVADSGFWDQFWGNPNADARRILIDNAEKIRTQNPSLTKEEALLAANRLIQNSGREDPLGVR